MSDPKGYKIFLDMITIEVDFSKFKLQLNKVLTKNKIDTDTNIMYNFQENDITANYHHRHN